MRFVKQPHRNRIKFSKSKYAKRTIRKLNKILIKVDNNKIEKKKKNYRKFRRFEVLRFIFSISEWNLNTL